MLGKRTRAFSVWGSNSCSREDAVKSSVAVRKVVEFCLAFSSAAAFFRFLACILDDRRRKDSTMWPEVSSGRGSTSTIFQLRLLSSSSTLSFFPSDAPIASSSALPVSNPASSSSSPPGLVVDIITRQFEGKERGSHLSPRSPSSARSLCRPSMMMSTLPFLDAMSRKRGSSQGSFSSLLGIAAVSSKCSFSSDIKRRRVK
mmetsp:Transcript_25529/g.47961  ORF Transcript_25529/g.47961 Transcript_25529/m.47961 type:complete len:201 (-) Transcript_25529:464-1066(-)